MENVAVIEEVKTTPSGASLNRLKHAIYEWGNYHNYYFHRTPVVPDARLSLLKLSLFQDKRILDLGCNAGKISIESLLHLKARSVRGIDIDEYLIQEASKLSKSQVTEEDSSKISFVCEDFMQDGYFQDETKAAGLQGSYDTILLLSITKWLHLHQGDIGLITLFQSLFNHLPSGGHLIIEPQEWENYKKAVSKNRNLRPVFKSLEMRPPFLNELKGVGFELVDEIERVEGGFSRPLLIWRKD